MDVSVSSIERDIELDQWIRPRLNEVNDTELVLNHYGGVQDVDGRDIVIQQLKPVDGGPDAWKVLIAAFIFEALLWGRHSQLTFWRLY